MANQMPVDHRTSETWLVILIFFVGFGVTIALLMLGGWNAVLISRAETAIEFYTNQRDAKDYRRRGKVRGSTQTCLPSPHSCTNL